MESGVESLFARLKEAAICSETITIQDVVLTGVEIPGKESSSLTSLQSHPHPETKIKELI